MISLLTLPGRATSSWRSLVSARLFFPSNSYLQVWRSGPLPGVPSCRRKTAGHCDCGPRYPRQGSKWDERLAGACGPAALQETATQDLRAERLTPALQRDVSLLAPGAIRPAEVSYQVQAVCAG